MEVQGMAVLNNQTQLKIDIIAKVNEGNISTDNAVKLLGKSKRTIERYLQLYRREGLQFAIHKNNRRVPVNKTSDTVKRKVQNLIKKKYFDLNLCHLREKLEVEENILVKRESLRKWAHEIHHVKRAKKRRPKARKRRERMKSPGLLLQMDGSPHRWFGDSKSCLIAIIDDANSELHGEFFESETTLGCMKVLKDVIKKRGIFKTLYVDRAGIFGGPKRCHFSQVQRACEELGIEIIFANSPEGKGRIERSFDTLQDRLIPEFRLNNITTMEAANKYLKNKFIPLYWNKNIMVQPENSSSQYTPGPEKKKMDQIFITKEYRKIRNDHTFSYRNRFYLIESKIKYSIAKQEIEIRKSSKENFKAYFAGEELLISLVKEPTKPSMFDLEIQKKIDAIELAKELENITEAAKRSGVSRQTIYHNKKLLEEKGPEALRRTYRKDHHHKNRPPEEVEGVVIDFSIDNPHMGQAQVARHLSANGVVTISSGGVRGIWLRHGMQTMALRLQKKNEIELSDAA